MLLASGEPAEEIGEAAEREKCDNEVRHKSLVPVLMVRGNPPPKEHKDK